MTDSPQSRPEAERARVPAMDILERISDPFVALDADWRFTYVNEKAAQVFATAPADLIGKDIWTEFPDRVDRPLHDACRRAAETQLPITIRDLNPLDDQWYEYSVYPAEDGVTCLFRDITECKQMEDALRANEKQLSDVLNSVTSYIGLMTPDGILLQANSAALEAAGLRPEDVLNKHFADTYWWSYSAESQSQLRAAIERAAQGEPVRFDADNRVGDEEFVTVDFGITPILDEEGKTVFLVPWGVDITDRVQAQAELADARDRLSLAIRAGNVGLWNWDLQTNEVIYSREWKSQLGYADDEIANDYAEWEKRVHPDDLESARATSRQFIQQPYPDYSNVFRMQHKDGSYRWILTNAALTTDEHGKPIRMIGSHIDITDQKKAEEDLQSSEERYRLLVENSPYAIGVQQDGKLIFVNSAALKLYGATSTEQLIGKPVQELVHPDTWDSAQDRINRLLQGETGLYPAEDRHVRLDSSEVWVEVTAVPFMLNGRPAIQVIALDITSRKQAEEELRSSEKLFSSIFHAGPAAMAITRLSDGVFIDVNDSFCSMFEFEREEIIGHTSTELNIMTPDERQRVKEQQNSSLELQNFELIGRSKTGRNISTLLTSKEMLIGGDVCYLTASIDITERKRAENLLEESEQRFRTLIERGSDLVILVDSEDRTTYVSPSVQTLLGYSPEEFYQIGRLAMVHPEDIDTLTSHIHWCFEHPGDEVEGEHRVLHKDGSWRTFQHLARSLLHDPTINAIVFNLTDITERKQIEIARRESEERYGFLFENMLNGFAFCKMYFDQGQPQDFVYLDVNGAFETLTGLKDVVGKNVSEVIPGIREHDPELFEAYGRVALTGVPETFETYLESLDMWFLISVYSPEKDYFVAVFDVITERKRAEKTLQEQAQQLSSIYDAVGDLIFYYAVEGKDKYRYISVNPSFLRATALERDQVVGKLMDEIVPPSAMPALVERYSEAIRQKQVVRWEETTQLAIGTMIGEVSLVPVFDEEGVCTHLVGTVHDITERKQAEERLSASQQELQRTVQRLEEAEERAKIASWEFDAESGEHWWSRQMYRMLGFDAEEGLPSFEAYLESIHPDDRKSVRDSVVNMERGEKPADVDFRSNPERGPIRYFSSSTHGNGDAQGTPVEFVGTTVDVTENKLAMDALQRSETRYRQLFQEAPILLAEIDFSDVKIHLDELAAGGVQDLRSFLDNEPDELYNTIQRLQVHDINAEAMRLFGVDTKEEFIDNLFWPQSSAVPEPRTDIVETLVAFSEGKTEQTQELISRIVDGAPRYFRTTWTVLSGYEEDYGKVLVLLIDISDRIEADIAIRDRVDQLELLGGITRASLAAESLPVMLQTIADSMGTLLNADSCYITRWDESTQRAMPAAASGRFRDIYPNIGPFPVGRSMTETVLESGLPLAIEDVFNSPYMNPIIAGQFDALSVLALPLAAGDQRLGAALIEYTSPHQFSDFEVERGRQAADQISLAIAKGLLVERAEQDAKELRTLSGKLMSVQEDERRELARELHDEIGQVLTAVNTSLHSLQLIDDPRAIQEQIQSSIDVVGRALKQIRELALELRPSILDDFGLAAALDWYVNALVERSTMEVKLELDLPDDALPAPLATTCFRLVQAALTNVERHAHATKAEVIVRRTPVQGNEAPFALELIVRDNGDGFDVDSTLTRVSQGAGMGLLGMQERARLSGGHMTIKSKPTHGTEIGAHLPLK